MQTTQAEDANHPSGRCKPPKRKMQTAPSGRCKPPQAEDANHLKRKMQTTLILQIPFFQYNMFRKWFGNFLRMFSAVWSLRNRPRSTTAKSDSKTFTNCTKGSRYVTYPRGNGQWCWYTVPGSHAWVCGFESLLDPHKRVKMAWSLCGIVEGCLWCFCYWKTPWIYLYIEGNFFLVPGFYLVARQPNLLKAT